MWEESKKSDAFAAQTNFRQEKSVRLESPMVVTHRAFFIQQSNKLTMKDDEFVRLTGKILRMPDLTSTDKIILAYSRTLPDFFASNEHIAATIGMSVKTVEKSVTKLRKLGLWRKGSPYRGRKKVGANPTGVGASSYSGREADPTRVGQNKPVLPMKTDSGEERREESLKKKAGEESAAGAADTDNSPQIFLKNKESQKTSELPKKTEVKFSRGSEGEALIGIESQGSAPVTVPVGPDGRPMTKEAMAEANFLAEFNDKPRPYSEAQLVAGRDKDAHDWQATAADEFAELFEKRAG